MKIVFVSLALASESIIQAMEEIKKEEGDIIELVYYFSHSIEEEEYDTLRVREDLRTADAVLIDLRGSGKACDMVRSVLPGLKNTVIVLVGASPGIMTLTRMGSFKTKGFMKERRGKKKQGEFDWDKTEKIMNMVEKAGKIVPMGIVRHARNWVHAIKYWTNGGKENLKNLLLMVAREYGNLKVSRPAPPIELPDYGIYHPELKKIYKKKDDYLKDYRFDPEKQSVGLFFYGGMHFDSSIVGVKAMIDQLEPHVNIIPVFSSGRKNLSAIREHFFDGETPAVDLIVSFHWFRVNTFASEDQEETLRLFKKLNVPLIHATPMYGREVKKWQESDMGLSPVEVMATVIMPEMDGFSQCAPCLGLKDREFEGRTMKTPVAIHERVETLTLRIRNWLRLQTLPNDQKRAAFIIYDYPPGESNIGSAAYLDVFASLKKILEAMEKEGYRTGEIPEERFQDLFLNTGAVNSGKWTSDEKKIKNSVKVGIKRYQDWFGRLPDQDLMTNEWGAVPGRIMSYKEVFFIPGIEIGNVFIGLQPSRGVHEEPEKATHDKTLPPHHQYVAFYKWLEHEWKADVCVHVGTHGTLEFLKGKEVGMSAHCFPDILIGAMPHLYIYHLVNPSEAMIAKRRSQAVIVNYNSPPFTMSDLYDQLAELEDLFGEYNEAALQHPNRAERVKDRLLKMAKEANFEGEDVDEIYDELIRMKRSIIPKGLHILDEDYDVEEEIDFIRFILRCDRGEAMALNRILCEKEGFEYEDILRNPSKTQNGKRYSTLLEEADTRGRALIKEAVKYGKLPDDPELLRTLRYGLNALEMLNKKEELKSLLLGMCGGFVPPNIGGDPIREPGTLPTGRNTYQFDPRLVPSEVAYVRGAEIAENTLKYYYGRHGSYPKSVAVILWGFETAKTRGETVGQILSYMGVRVVRRQNLWAPAIEVIPLEELKRPRVDVMVNICGFFRDMFPNVMQLIDQAVEEVSALDEPDHMNFVKANTKRLFEEIKRSGDEKTAGKLANARVFGPRPGEYGTRLINLIETSNWEDESELADAFIQSMNHVYTDNIHGKRVDGIYRKRLSSVGIVSQVRDTHEYEIGDLDHYYEFFGGLSKSVETVRGEKPEMLITDTSKEVILTESVEHAIRRGARTRLLNPKFIEELLKHDYHGAQKIAQRVEYLIGHAATTNRVDNWIWSEVSARYIFDKDIFARMTENNRYATAEIIERLLEANKRGYWKASDDELERLRDAYLELEGFIEEKL